MKVINKRNLYPIFFLSGILILVLFFSGFSFLEGLTTTPTTTPVVKTTPTPVVNSVATPVVKTTPAPVVNTTPTPVVNTTPTPVVNTTPAPVVSASIPNTEPTTIPIQVSPATAAIVSGALDSIVQMGVSVIKNSNAAVKQVEATANTPSYTSANWTPISSTSTTR